MKLIANIECRIDILPHFIKHYTNRGVDCFIFGLWRGKNNENWNTINDILITKKVKYIIDQSKELYDYRCGKDDSDYQNDIRIKYVRSDEWYVITDLDEFQDIDDYNILQENAIKEQSDCVLGVLIDRIAENGQIPNTLESNITIEKQFPICAKITEKISKGNVDKSLVQSGLYKIESGHHFCNGKPFSKKYNVYHYKWYGNVLDSLIKRYNNYVSLNLPWQNEPYNVYKHIVYNEGHFKLSDDLLFKF